MIIMFLKNIHHYSSFKCVCCALLDDGLMIHRERIQFFFKCKIILFAFSRFALSHVCRQTGHIYKPFSIFCLLLFCCCGWTNGFDSHTFRKQSIVHMWTTSQIRTSWNSIVEICRSVFFSFVWYEPAFTMWCCYSYANGVENSSRNVELTDNWRTLSH